MATSKFVKKINQEVEHLKTSKTTWKVIPEIPEKFCILIYNTWECKSSDEQVAYTGIDKNIKWVVKSASITLIGICTVTKITVTF